MNVHPLRIWRVAQGLSQAEIAQKLGVTQVTISKWERGEAIPHTRSATMIEKISNGTVRPGDLVAAYEERNRAA